MLRQDIKVTRSREKKKSGGRNRLKGVQGAPKKEKPPIFGMIQRGEGGDRDAIQCPADNHCTVNQATIVQSVYTDEYAIYTPLSKWGYEHKTVCHGRGSMRDERWIL